MKIFTFKKIHLVVFSCLIVCVFGIIVLSIGRVIQVNTTPATNKVVILDARAPESRRMVIA